MPKIKFIVGNRPYEISCNEGDEDRITNLAKSLDNRVEEVRKGFGNASEAMVLAVTALLMEDEIRTLKSGLPVQNYQASTAQNEDDIKERIDRCIAEALAPYTERLEALALSLEVG